MFRVNRRTDYSIRVMLSLARRPAGARLSTQLIQEEMLIPRPFLQRIIADLSKANLVHTFAGPNGGLELARPAGKISMLDIWEAVEGPLLISACIKEPKECPLNEGCPVNRRWGRLQALMVHEMRGIPLQQLAEEAGLIPAGAPASAAAG